MDARGVSLGQLVLALDSTLVTLLAAPRGLDVLVRSAALIDSDDVRLGLSVGATPSDVFFLLGIGDNEAVHWIGRLADENRLPAAIFVKRPSEALVDRSGQAGTAVVSVQPQARWDRLYRLVNHVFEHHADRENSASDSETDLFGLAQSVADRTHGMVSIEDAQSHVLAYSASNDEADELRRLSILGRAGPSEHLQWLTQWGIFDALRAAGEVVHIAERPELGIRPRLAVGIHRHSEPPVGQTFAGAIWVQQGSAPLAEDAAEVLRGASVLAGRIISRLSSRPSAHLLHVQRVFGLADQDKVDFGALGRELQIAGDAQLAVIGFEAVTDGRTERKTGSRRITDALALSANAFRPDAHVAPNGSRVYVMLPGSGRAVESWVRGTIAALHRELGLDVRGVIAAGVIGLPAVATARTEIDRVLDSAARHPVAIDPITTLARARTTVLLDEIITMISHDDRLIDPRVRELRQREPLLAMTLQTYLDCFGDVATAAAELQVHPNTVRYRIRRLERLLDTSVSDPNTRLLLGLSLRATS
jgi:DNA-binding PucR family transcriptional regulator